MMMTPVNPCFCCNPALIPPMVYNFPAACINMVLDKYKKAGNIQLILQWKY